MAKLVALPSPNGTNIERLFTGPHGMVRQPPAYDARHGLKARDEDDPEEGEGENQRPDPLTELLSYLEAQLTSPEAYSRAKQLVTGVTDWMDGSTDGPPHRSTTRGGAMDSAQVLKAVHATMAAQAHTTPVVGPIEASSAAATYRIALKRLGADSVPNIDSVPALKQLFDLARRHPAPSRSAASAASASSSLTERFGPLANRLKRSY